MSPRPILVLGLGNDLLTDDAVGIRVAEKLRDAFPRQVEVSSTSQFGLALLDELQGREKVLLIDSYVPEEHGRPAIQEWDLDGMGGAFAVSPHFFGLAEIREVMRALEMGFPREVRILAVPVLDTTTFSTEMTPQAAARVDEAARRAETIVRAWIPARTSSHCPHGHRARPEAEPLGSPMPKG